MISILSIIYLAQTQIIHNTENEKREYELVLNYVYILYLITMWSI